MGTGPPHRLFSNNAGHTKSTACAMRCSVVWCCELCCGVVWGAVWGAVWWSVVWWSVVWCGVVWYGMVWSVVAQCVSLTQATKVPQLWP